MSKAQVPDVDSVAPPLALSDSRGERFDLADARDDEALILLFFRGWW